MENLKINDLIVSVPKDKLFSKRDLEFHIKLLGCWNSTCLALAQKIFETYVNDTIIEIGGIGIYSLLALKQEHNIKLIETNPSFKNAFIESASTNNIDSTHYEYMQLHISTNVLLNGRRCTPLKDVINKGCLFLKLSPGSLVSDILESGRPLLNKVSFIMFDTIFIIKKRLNKDCVLTLRMLIEEGFRLFEFDTVFKYISNFDKHLANKLDNIDTNTIPRIVLAVYHDVDIEDLNL